MKVKNISLLAGSGLLAVLAVSIALSGCASAGPKTTAPAENKSGSSPKVASSKGGAQLWSENCIRCHNIRSPNFYNDAQWDVAMMHMRVRANLTAEESRKILGFLKTAD
jgi:cytochrome c5